MAFAKVYDHVDGNRLTLLEDPRVSADYKIELIKKAKHHIHILTFFWDDSSIPQEISKELSLANARGVEVRILSSFVPTFGTDILGKGRKNLKPLSKATFTYQALTPSKLFSLTHNFHEKIFLVDGEIAIIGGRNMSDSSLFGKDMEVKLEGPVVNQVQDHFKLMFDFLIEMKMTSNCLHEETSKACEEKYRELKFDSGSSYFPEQSKFEENIPARIITHEAVIHQYEKGMNRDERPLQQDDILDTVVNFEFKKLKAYNYFIIPTQRYREFLEKNLAKGNSIEIITNSMESAKFSSNWGYFYSIPDALDLVQKGLELYQWERNQKMNYVHEKVMVFDDERVVIGSHNFVVGSTSVSNEIVIDFKSREIAARLTEVFDNEKNDSKITQKASLELLQNEYEQNKTKIKYIRSKTLSKFLKEAY